MAIDDWQKKKVIGKITKIKNTANYMQLFIYNIFTKKTELIFIFDENTKNYINGVDVSNHYIFFVDDKTAKNNKVYNSLKSADYIKKISKNDLKIAKLYYFKSIFKHRDSTWDSDMARADDIILEVAETLKKWKEQQNKKYWDDVSDEHVF